MMGIPSTFLQISLAMFPQTGEVSPDLQASAEPINLDIAEGWLDPWPHNHFSRKGTPFIHLFSLEPAFLDRDFFLDYRWASGSEGKEIEVEAELEWALTRRLGIVVEAPFARLSPDGGATSSGLGDLEIAPRALLIDNDNFLLSGNIAVSLPSGDDGAGLGRGELGLAPSVSAWFDLGHWVQASAQVGTEHGVESGEMEFFYNAALAHSFQGPSLMGTSSASRSSADSSHYPVGLTSTILEFTGRSILDGENDGEQSAEILLGVSHNLIGSWEVRAGYQTSVGEIQEFDDAFIFSLVFHF